MREVIKVKNVKKEKIKKVKDGLIAESELINNIEVIKFVNVDVNTINSAVIKLIGDVNNFSRYSRSFSFSLIIKVEIT